MSYQWTGFAPESLFFDGRQMTRPRCHQRTAKKQRGQCLTLTALKPCLAAPYRAFTGHGRAYRATPRLNRDTPRLTGPRKYYYGLLATKFQPTTMWRGKRAGSRLSTVLSFAAIRG
jgi:hypothetical protein